MINRLLDKLLPTSITKVLRWGAIWGAAVWALLSVFVPHPLVWLFAGSAFIGALFWWHWWNWELPSNGEAR